MELRAGDCCSEMDYNAGLYTHLIAAHFVRESMREIQLLHSHAVLGLYPRSTPCFMLTGDHYSSMRVRYQSRPSCGNGGYFSILVVRVHLHPGYLTAGAAVVAGWIPKCRTARGSWLVDSFQATTSSPFAYFDAS